MSCKWQKPLACAGIDRNHKNSKEKQSGKVPVFSRYGLVEMRKKHHHFLCVSPERTKMWQKDCAGARFLV